ncbi:MAG: DUF523 and DUF1722 domain-containing protein [Pseudomonadota bacterium]|uniref:YbgA family protein n=1 Tax=Pseudohongiella sp. O18 TaxID=2904248 RepID=UPI001F42BB2C|nr:DUF523 and DUF1722 domain-containing protein [Pseudohongiella sp. O18]MEC8858636.1 DUF523 and DUF1722 domain-containing protein [Pseudomonadota bacterium]
MNEHQHQKIPVGISACLVGEEVRFNGGHKQHSYIQRTLGQYFEFRTFCPEVDIGLGIPRRPIRLVKREDEVRCVDFEDDTLDYTDKLTASADAQAHWVGEMCGFILKKDSPSCGMERVKVYGPGHAPREGAGIFAARMMERFPELPVEEEGRLGDAVLRENFIQRVYVMNRWRQLVADGLSVASLTDFHARHKLILMSHCQKAYRRLGPLVASARKDNVFEVAKQYLPELMQALKERASRGDHVNVLQHIQGYLKEQLDAQDKEELREMLERYHKGLLPLIVPITLLNHHFRRNPVEYIERSWYMHPYPAEMALQNHI